MRALGRNVATACVVAVVLVAAAPRATYDPSICLIEACGHASFDRTTAAIGQKVIVTVDNGYFGFWTAEEWAGWCGSLAVSIQVHGSLPPDDVLAPLTITGWDTATFVVPTAPLGTYGIGLSCSGDGGFAQPTLPETFTIGAWAPDTAIAEDSTSGSDDPWVWLASLLAGLTAAAAILLNRPRNRRRPEVID